MAETFNPFSAITLDVSPREFDTIIAGLRVYQVMKTMNSTICEDVAEIATEHGEELSIEDIDALVERINGGNKVLCSQCGCSWDRDDLPNECECGGRL